MEHKSLKPQASSLKPQASSLKPQASSLKPQASRNRLKTLFFVCQVILYLVFGGISHAASAATTNSTPSQPTVANPIVSQPLYQDGDTLKITLPELPMGQSQYVGLNVPNYGLFILDNLNHFNNYDAKTLPLWQGGQTAVNMPADKTLPRGKYDSYLLRTNKGVNPLPINTQSALGISSFVVMDTIKYSQITDPNSNLAMVARAGNETVSIFGKKDAQGRLISVEGITFGSQTDKSKNLTIELDANSFPKKVTFPDKSSADLANYTDSGATAIYRTPAGKVIKQATVKLPMDKLKKAAAAAQKYTASPQPTNGNPVPSKSGSTSSATDSNCLEVMTAFHDVASNLLWGAFQIASIASCGIAVGEAVATAGILSPLAIWACGSVILNGVDHIADAVTKGHSPFKKLNEANGLLGGAVACAMRDWAGCAQGVAENFTGGMMDAFEPEKVCKSQKCTVQSNIVLKQWCDSRSATWYEKIQACVSGASTNEEVTLLKNKCIELNGFISFEARRSFECRSKC